MLSVIRKSVRIYNLQNWFKKQVNLKFKKIEESDLEDNKKQIIKSIKEVEESIEGILSEYEKELKVLETKYDNKIYEKIALRNEIIKKSSDNFNHFWYNALSNHKLFKDFIAVEDAEALRHLTGISYEKCNQSNVSISLK